MELSLLYATTREMSVTCEDDIDRIIKFVADCNAKFEDSKCDIKESTLGGLASLPRLTLGRARQY